MVGFEQITAFVGSMTAKQGVLTVLFLGAASTTGLNYKIDRTEQQMEEKLDLILSNQQRNTDFLQREMDYMHRAIDKIDHRIYEGFRADTVFFDPDNIR